MADAKLKAARASDPATDEILMGIAGSLAQSPVGQAHNRFMGAVATTWATATNECTFASPGVHEVTVTVPNTQIGGTAITLLSYVQVLADSPNDAYTLAVLTTVPTTTATTDFPPSFVAPNTSKTFTFSSRITRLDLLAFGTACPVLVEAV